MQLVLRKEMNGSAEVMKDPQEICTAYSETFAKLL